MLKETKELLKKFIILSLLFCLIIFLLIKFDTKGLQPKNQLRFGEYQKCLFIVNEWERKYKKWETEKKEWEK